ncbi:MAG: 4-(cytidine 5'-diphospho)-2-C-methyl-D-erythritol kinase, partial [Candidatus Omnitrophica bacterium]|nr:4-(cytidine 5'-diphospho)-2-C-methyl-D-erythritol kinase [Candidatus Omnitrophota bacterium]
LKDSISLKSRRDSLITVSCSDKTVPSARNNLCFKAAMLLRDTFYPAGGVDIKIFKRIPVGAGLGGGSSNAASVLLGLNKLWKLNLPKAKLAKIASCVGSDVPFFIYEKAFALGSGRGEKIEPLGHLNKTKLWHLLIVPDIHVSTPLIYRHWDSFAGLTKPPGNVKILLSALKKKSLTLKPDLLFNSLEQVTLRLYTQARKVKGMLSELGLECVLMSGSGPAIFALLNSEKKALKMARVIRAKYRSWRVFAVHTVTG